MADRSIGGTTLNMSPTTDALGRSPPTGTGLGHVTCSGQWGISKHDTDRDWLGLVVLEQDSSAWHTVETHGVTGGRVDEGRQAVVDVPALVQLSAECNLMNDELHLLE